MNRRAISTLSAAHLFTDINQGALPAMLPFLIVQRHLSYEAAAGLVFAANAVSSLVQPLFGHFADRRSIPGLIPLGLLAAGVGLALIGVAPSYEWAVVAALLSGIGVAAFHPGAARIVSYAAGERRATGMSWFAFGGNAGFAGGPALMTALMVGFGLNGSLLMIIPAVIISALLASQLARLTALDVAPSPRKGAIADTTPRDRWGAFSRLTAAVVCRSIIAYALNTFLPLYWIKVLGQNEGAGGAALAVMLTSGALGTLLVGWLADRYGRRTVVFSLVVTLTPLLLLLLSLKDAGWATMVLIPLGLALVAPTSVMVVLGQEYLPNRIGVASGVTLGLAMSVGGLSAPILGWVADNHGLHTTLLGIAFLPLLVAALAYTLPRPPRKARPRATSARPPLRFSPASEQAD